MKRGLQRMRGSALAGALVLLAACGSNAPPAAPSTPPAATSTPVAAVADASNGNRLEMRIDGQLWQADHDVFGAFHPPGYDKAVLIAGSRGPKDAHEQAFNLNLFGIDGPGSYRIRHSNPPQSAAQFANLSAERFLAGNLLGFDMTVDLRQVSSEPPVVEATFSGTLTANDGAPVRIESGVFRYRE